MFAAVALVAAGCGGPSPEAACKHMLELAKKAGGDERSTDADALADCKASFDKFKERFGAEVASKMAACTMKAKELDDLHDCDPNKFGKPGGGGKSMTANAKTTEARQFVRRMYDGARAYYMDTPMSGASMTPQPAQFPGPSVGPVPPLGDCCKQGGTCEPVAANWTAPTWVALQFSVDDPHYYSYKYKVSPDGMSYTVSAYGDLDCDGVYSTFEMYGKIDESSAGGPIGKAGIYIDKTLE